MKFPIPLLINILVLSLFLSACNVLTPRKVTLDELRGLDKVERIELYVFEKESDEKYYQPHHIRSIKDSEQINQIVEILRKYADDWQHSGFGSLSPLLGPVQIVFHSKKGQETVIEIGYTSDTPFFLRQYKGPGRYLSKAEFKELMKVLEIDEEAAYYER